MTTSVRTITVTGAFCVASWVLCFIHIGAALVLAFADHEHGLAWSLALSNFGLLFGMVGGVLMIRGYFDRFGRQLEVREAEWEAQAFDAGRALGRAEGESRELRRI